MDFLDNYADSAQEEILNEIQKIVEEKGIKEKILEEAQSLAQQEAMHIIDPKNPESPTFEGINLSSEERDEFLLVLDYLESIGLRFTPTVLKYESQNPNVQIDREALCKQHNLRFYDKTPLLVQLIEEKLNSFSETN